MDKFSKEQRISGLIPKAQDFLLFRKFGHYIFYIFCPSFCGQIFKISSESQALRIVYFVSGVKVREDDPEVEAHVQSVQGWPGGGKCECSE